MSENFFDVAKLAKEKGNKAFEAKDYATARILYSQAMKIDPSQYIYPLNSAIANIKLERWRDAEFNATTALELSPDNLEALFGRGLARTELHQWSQARQDVQAFLDGGGCSVKGRAVLEATTRFEAASPPDPISDKSNESSSVFENLPPDDVQPGLAIRDSKVDGKGVFATREFKRGDKILHEKPLLTTRAALKDLPGYVEAELRKMSPENLARFLSLHNAHNGNCCADRLPHHASQIFDSNLIMLTNGSKGVCFHASRFNHSCTPNASHDFDPATGEFWLYALGPIREGEEIFKMYSYGNAQHMYITPRAGRQAELHNLYHFTCACAVCTLSDTASQASDTRRVWLSELGDRIESEPQVESLEGILRHIVEAVRIFREEGIQEGPAIFMVLAVIVCAHCSDWASAKYWAEMTVDEYGEDSSEVQDEFRKHLFQPTLLPEAGLGPQQDFSGIRLD